MGAAAGPAVAIGDCESSPTGATIENAQVGKFAEVVTLSGRSVATCDLYCTTNYEAVSGLIE